MNPPVGVPLGTGEDARTPLRSRGEAPAQRAVAARGADDAPEMTPAAAIRAPPCDPVEFVRLLRLAHSQRKSDPSGANWPYTSHDTINRTYSLDDHRELHAVTKEVLEACVGLTPAQQLAVSIAVRYTCSARGAAHRYRDALLAGSLPDALLKPLPFPHGAPYRNVVSKHEILRR